MARALAHRGPDGDALFTWPDGRLSFGAGRLAIIDLSAPAGPLFNEDGQVGVVFNGEIYNYRVLRAELEMAGHTFRTHTDTEVVVHGYEQWGERVVERLRGIFAFGVYDANKKRLLLARDRMGEKPLYVAHLAPGELVFASEAKALFQHSGLRRAVDLEQLPVSLLLGYTPPERTLFAGIDKLRPGERRFYRLSGDQLVAQGDLYWEPIPDAREAPPYSEAVSLVRETLEETVAAQMMSDVPVGAFLSGGVDSTSVVALMRRSTTQPLHTFTVGFDFPAGDRNDTKFNVDERYAALVAERFGTQHHVIKLKQDETLSDLLPALVYAMDEPVVAPTMVLTAYVAALARLHNVPVLLNGEAGDELFLGYEHYRMDRLVERYAALPNLLRRHLLDPVIERLPPQAFGGRGGSARKLVHKARQQEPVARYLEWLRNFDAALVPELLIDPKLNANVQSNLQAVLLPFLEAGSTRHFAERIGYTDARLLVPENRNHRVDRMAMAFGIEARTPLEDVRVVELAMRLPLRYKLRNGDFKMVFKDAVRDLIPREVLERPKWGFVPPASQWLRSGLRPLVERFLSREYVESAGIFRPETVARLVQSHLHEGGYQLYPLWTLLTFHLWHALYIDQSLTLEHALQPHDFFASSFEPVTKT